MSTDVSVAAEPTTRAKPRDLPRAPSDSGARALPTSKPSDLGATESGASSTIEFQAPHASQRPAHLRWTAPQAVQVNWGAGLAMPFLARCRGGHQALASRRSVAQASAIDPRMQPANR